MKRIVWLSSIIIFLIIVVLPFVFLVFDALRNQEVSLGEFIQLCFNERAVRLLANSLFIGSGATLLGLAFGVPLGFLIARTDIYLKGLLRYVYLLPLLIPSYIASIAWIELLGSKGSINAFLIEHTGLQQGPLTIYGLFGAMWVLGLSYFPFITLLTISGLTTLDRRLEEQAELALNQWQVLKRITFSLITPFIIAGSLFVFVFSVANYGVPALLRVNVYPIEIFVQFSTFYNHHRAVLSSFPLLLICMVLIIISYCIMKDKCYVSLEGRSKKPKTIQLKQYRIIYSLFAWLVVFISGILPLIVLIISSGSITSYKVALKTSFRPILTSIGLSVLGATLCVLLGFFLSFFIERTKSRLKRGFDIATILPLALPPTVLGIGLIRLWNRPITSFIYSGFLIVIFGFIARFIPFAIRTLTSSFKQLNPNIEEAAVLSGAGFLKTTWKILLPLTKEGILVSWIICFIFCMGELSTTLLVMPAGFETLSTKIYTLMHYGVGKLTSALCVILIFATIAPIVLLSWIFKERHALWSN